jgi:indole-3-glycerol phosphate synthase
MSVLDEIFAHKADEVASAKRRVSEFDLRSKARDSSPPRGFLKALSGASTDLALIAEVKKASPSKGVIRPDFRPADVARAYEEAGAQALSVLTDERYFQGSAENLEIARRSTKLPCLRKDFLNSPYQLYEARAWEADAILLIVAALERNQLVDLHALGTDLGMDILVEVHDVQETNLAIELGCPLIGVNNRNLQDFSVSLTISEELLPIISPSAFAVSESALEKHEDLERVREAGARAVLIGTSFCAADNIEKKVKEVMGW